MGLSINSGYRWSRAWFFQIASITHSLWLEQQKENQTIVVSPQNQYINEQWGKNFRKLPKAEQDTFTDTLLKCLASTGPTYTEEDTTQMEEEAMEPEKVPTYAPYEVPAERESRMTKK